MRNMFSDAAFILHWFVMFVLLTAVTAIGSCEYALITSRTQTATNISCKIAGTVTNNGRIGLKLDCSGIGATSYYDTGTTIDALTKHSAWLVCDTYKNGSVGHCKNASIATLPR